MRGGCFIRRENPMINGFLVRGKVSCGRQSSSWRMLNQSRVCWDDKKKSMWEEQPVAGGWLS